MTRMGGKYELLEPVGEGGMAHVWRGLTHGASGFTKLVAIKRVKREFARDPGFAAMFVEEARVVSALQHPNIVQVFDFDQDADGGFFIVMEWIDGLDMEHWVRAHEIGRARTPWHLTTAIAVEVLRAVTAAHERVDEQGKAAPVIHRDINPANIMLGVSGHVKLADFGLARATDRSTMTGPGMIKGKLSYLAPEIVNGAPASPLTDLFGVGIVLWEALSGKRLFAGRSPGDVVLNVAAANIPPLQLEREDLPPTLVEVVHTALARKPEDRFDSADEMLRTLTAILRTHPEPTDAKPLAWSARLALARLRAG